MHAPRVAPAVRLGVKVHWRDVDALVPLAREHGATVLEYQMLPGDLERHRDRAFDAFLPYRREFELRVHQPEWYELDGARRFLDPASPDEAERERGVRVLGECARLAMEMRAKALIVHPGGVGSPFGDPALLRASLEDLPRHVRILLENMPAHYGSARSSAPWARSGEDLARFADLVDGFTLDVSHAYLSEGAGSRERVLEVARALAPRVRHVHAGGSRGGEGHAGEGVPFARSDYDASFVREVLALLPPDVVVVPEIMDGHLEGGLAFEEAFAALRAATR